MGNITWVCQTNLGTSPEDIDIIKQTCEENNYNFIPLKVIPFSDNIPSFLANNITIFYGAVRWIDKVFESNKWTPCAFKNDNFDYNIISQYYRNHMLNSNYITTTLKDLEAEDNTNYFIRPVKDNKAFTGTVMNSSSIKSWREKLIAGQFDLSTESIIAAPPKILSHEWRLFIIDKKVIASSIYKRYGILYTKDKTNPEVIEFAEQMANIFSPHDIFVIDIAIESGDNKLKVIETGCINSAGFYNANIKDIIKGISKYCIRRY